MMKTLALIFLIALAACGKAQPSYVIQTAPQPRQCNSVAVMNYYCGYSCGPGSYVCNIYYVDNTSVQTCTNNPLQPKTLCN